MNIYDEQAYEYALKQLAALIEIEPKEGTKEYVQLKEFEEAIRQYEEEAMEIYYDTNI